MDITEKINLTYPLPIAKLYQAMRLTADPKERVYRQITLLAETVQYLALIGLGNYIHLGQPESKVEAARRDLEQPTLENWIQMLKVVSRKLMSADPTFLSVSHGVIYRGAHPITNGVKALCKIAHLPMPKRVMLYHFWDTVAEFHYKKIFHGILTAEEAAEVSQPLEESLNHWLGTLATLQERPLLHIARLNWQSPYNIYIGSNLSTGTMPSPFEYKNNKPIYHNYVYLHWVAHNEFILLHPFFVYDPETATIYRYSELAFNDISQEDEAVLKCPYEVPPGVKETISLKIDLALVLGTKGRPRWHRPKEYDL